MPNAKYDGRKPHVNIGTIGQAGHGKTSLTAAITRVMSARVKGNTEVVFESIDMAREESKNGVTYSVSRVEYVTDKRHYTHVDCPRHPDYVKNMIIDDTQMDGAILVVAANEGVMAQTIEHILLSRQVGAPHIVVFINKCDMEEDADILDFTEREVREILNQHGFSGNDTPIIRGSALKALENPSSQWGDKIMELMEAMERWIPNPQRETEKPFLMAVEEAVAITGRGTVANGRVERGTLRVHDEVEISGSREENIRAVVSGIEMFRKTCDVVEAGDDVGVLMRDVHRSDVERGRVLAKPGTARGYKRFTARVYILTINEGGRHTPLLNNIRQQFHFRIGDVTGTCMLPEGVDMCAPGDNIEMSIEVNDPTPMERGLSFTIHEGGGRTVAAGRVVEIIG